MISVLHLSDLHVGEHPSRRAALARIVSWIISNLSPATTLIAITGDITDNGHPWEWKRAGEELLRLRVKGFVVLLVPGNHDCGDKGVRWQEERRAGFNLLWRSISATPLSARWPQVFTFGGWKFIMLDSSEGQCDDFITLARGEIGKSQLARLEIELQDTAPTAVLMHHDPTDAPDFMHALDEADEVCGLLGRREIPLLLFGHMHRRRELRAYKGIGLAYDAGKTTDPDGDAYAINLHRLGADGSVVTHEMRVPLKAS